MSDFKVKMHKIRFPPGLRAPEPAGGAYSAPPDLLAVFKGAASKRREGEGEDGGRKKEVKRKGREWRREGR